MLRAQSKQTILIFAVVSLLIGFITGETVVKFLLTLITPEGTKIFVTDPGVPALIYMRFALVYSLFIWLALVCWISFYRKWKSKPSLAFSMILTAIGLVCSASILKLMFMQSIELTKRFPDLPDDSGIPLNVFALKVLAPPLTGIILILLSFGILKKKVLPETTTQ